MLDIEQPDELLAYLRETNRLAPGEEALCTPLSGGVSNRTVRVDRRHGAGASWVLKQALPKLRVPEDWFCDPARIEREALGLHWLAQLAPPGSVPAEIFVDPEQRLLAMEAVPQPHENWKQQLLTGQVERAYVEQFGSLLGQVHRRSSEQRAELQALFAERSYFESLRLEPYYRVSAARNLPASIFLQELIAETLATRLALVHGDYSPKNVLIESGRVILLDHEVIHFGDPSFDLGFALTHLLSKANHVVARRELFLAAANWFWESYSKAGGPMAALPGLESRAVRHTLACLLARVDGRSPLEYLSEDERARQRAVALALMQRPPARVPELVASFAELLESPR
jgi:5-methylthioribose kinase